MRVLIIILFNLLVYHRTFLYGYVSDDCEVSKHKKPEIKNFWHGLWLQFMGHRYVNSIHAHIMTVAVHTLCCVLIYLAFGKTNVSFLASILFSVNPINNQGVLWLSGRSYAMTGVLALLMWMFPLFSPIPYYFTLFFGPSAWFFPLMFLFTEYWWLVFMIIPFFLLKRTQGIFKKKITGFKHKTVNKEMIAVAPRKIIPFCKTFGYYFRICIFPFKIGLYHKFLYGIGTNKYDNKLAYRLDIHFWWGLFVICLIGTNLIWNYSPCVFGMVWYAVCIAMWCNFITIQQHLAERYVYVANIGLQYALAYFLLNL